MKGPAAAPEGGTKHAVHARDDGRCRYCGVLTSHKRQNMPYSRTVDHVIPVSKGGRTNIINLVTCCKACNDAKKHFTLAEMGMKMLPVPLHTEEQKEQWRRMTFPDTCINCGRFSRQHSRPLYHGGPRDCRNGVTLFLAMAHHQSLVKRGQNPVHLWSSNQRDRQPGTTTGGA